MASSRFSQAFPHTRAQIFTRPSAERVWVVRCMPRSVTAPKSRSSGLARSGQNAPPTLPDFIFFGSPVAVDTFSLFLRGLAKSKRGGSSSCSCSCSVGRETRSALACAPSSHPMPAKPTSSRSPNAKKPKDSTRESSTGTAKPTGAAADADAEAYKKQAPENKARDTVPPLLGVSASSSKEAVSSGAASDSANAAAKTRLGSRGVGKMLLPFLKVQPAASAATAAKSAGAGSSGGGAAQAPAAAAAASAAGAGAKAPVSSSRARRKVPNAARPTAATLNAAVRLACLSVCYSNAFVRCVSCVDVALRGATITVLLCPEVSRGCLVTY